jgi:hypothetical protein
MKWDHDVGVIGKAGDLHGAVMTASKALNSLAVVVSPAIAAFPTTASFSNWA